MLYQNNRGTAGDLQGVGGSGAMIRIVLVDDQALIRLGLRSVLSREPWIDVVGEAADGVEAVDLCRREKPDVVLMDIEMPNMDGLTAARRIKEEFPTTSVLVLTGHDNIEYLLRAVSAGAAGYLLKEHALERVVGAVRRVVNQESPLDQELTMRLLRRLSEENAPGQEASHETPSGAGSSKPANSPSKPSNKHFDEIDGALTPREREILSLVAEGCTNQRIADQLFVGVGTVKTHVHRIIAKLGVSDRTQAAVLAIRLGLADRRGDT